MASSSSTLQPMVTAPGISFQKVGIYQWPRELKDCYNITLGLCRIRFTGYKTDRADQEDDYYLVEILEAEQSPAGDAATEE